jgi:hypothetical protein
MHNNIKIFEPIYKENQILSDLLFSPLARDKNSRSDWREFQILVDIYKEGRYLESDFVGVFSPKFNLKCKITSFQFLEFVHDNPGRDVYFINPFPQIPYWSFNVWMQGEFAHRGLCIVAQELLDICGINVRIDRIPRHGPDILLYSNFWVGSPKFWKSYVGDWLVPIADFLEANPDHAVSLAVMQQTTHTNPAPFLPFIVERLFSTFLSINKDCNFIGYKIEADKLGAYCATSFERLIFDNMRDQINNADANKQFSPELISNMKMLTALHQQHFDDFFESNIHPHTGSVIPKNDAI